MIEAKLVQTTELHDKDDPEGISAHVFTLRVNRVLRGKIGGTVRVYEANDSGRATLGWVQGKQYLLFLFYESSEGSWALDGRGNSGPIDKANVALSEIATIKAAHGGGVIHGVVSGQELADGVARVQIEAKRAAGWFTTRTNEKGEFQLTVSVGQHVVRATKDGFDSGDSDIS